VGGSPTPSEILEGSGGGGSQGKGAIGASTGKQSRGGGAPAESLGTGGLQGALERERRALSTKEVIKITEVRDCSLGLGLQLEGVRIRVGVR